MSSTTPSSLDAMEMLDIGQTCSQHYCHVHDFLPFSCPCCSRPFCSDHWKPQSHACNKQRDDPNIVQLPQCPLCHKTISLKAGQDPNEPMDQHLSQDCVVLRPGPQKRKKPDNECRQKRCRTKLITPIHCTSCKQPFCPTHRFPQDHDCTNSKASLQPPKRSAASGNAGLAALARVRATANKAVAKAPQQKQRVVINLDDSSDEERSSSAGSPLLGSNTSFRGSSSSPNPSIAATSSPDPALGGPSGASWSSEVEVLSDVRNKAKGLIPSASDRRAKAERSAQLKSLDTRAKKGLLTEKEKVLYATLQAKEARGGSDKGKCLIV